VEDAAALEDRLGSWRSAGNEGTRRREHARIPGTPSPGINPPVERPGRDDWRGGLPRTEGTGTRARGLGYGITPGSPSQIDGKALDQRGKASRIGTRSDQVAAAGPGGARSAEALEHEQHNRPGPHPRQSLEVCFSDQNLAADWEIRLLKGTDLEIAVGEVRMQLETRVCPTKTESIYTPFISRFKEIDQKEPENSKLNRGGRGPHASGICMEQTPGSGLELPLRSSGSAMLGYDNDGQLDVYVSCHGRWTYDGYHPVCGDTVKRIRQECSPSSISPERPARPRTD
jgi:hypothetical protein